MRSPVAVANAGHPAQVTVALNVTDAIGGSVAALYGIVYGMSGVFVVFAPTRSVTDGEVPNQLNLVVVLRTTSALFRSTAALLTLPGLKDVDGLYLHEFTPFGSTPVRASCRLPSS